MTVDELRVRSEFALPRRVQILSRVVAALAVVAMLTSLLSGHLSWTIVSQGAFWVIWALTFGLRNDVVVTRQGIRWPPFGNLSWDKVSYVQPDSRWRQSVTVVLRSGRERQTGAPRELAAEVARIGGVPYGVDGRGTEGK